MDSNDICLHLTKRFSVFKGAEATVTSLPSSYVVQLQYRLGDGTGRVCVYECTIDRAGFRQLADPKALLDYTASRMIAIILQRLWKEQDNV